MASNQNPQVIGSSINANSPEEYQFLEQTIRLLKDSQSTDYNLQRQVNQRIEEWSKLPQFNYALMCVLSDPNSLDDVTRSIGCLVLKNNVRKNYTTFPQELRDLIKNKALELLRDPSATIRSTAGILITTIASNGELFSWSELLPTLGQMLNANSIEIVEAGFSALQRICEDLAEALSSDERSLDSMLPRFLEFFKHPEPKIRNYALNCVNQFVPILSKPITNRIDSYVEALFLLANDQDPEIKKNVCRSIVTLTETKPDCIASHLTAIIDYMIARCKDEDPDVAIEACEFWLSIPDQPLWRETIKQYLPQLIPWFMEKMHYSPEDVEEMQGQFEDDYMIPDKDDDIKPRFHRTTKKQGYNFAANAAQQQGGGDDDESNDISDLEDADLADDEYDDDDDYDSNDGDNLQDTTWNLRKCTAAALDSFSHNYGDDILPFVFQEVQKNLNSENWLDKEAAVLAVGAVAIGSLDGMIPHLPNLIPFLIERLRDKHPFVRSITCWSISRYTSWIIQNPQECHFGEIINDLLQCVLDDNKRVQEAACSSFATIAEAAGVELVPHLDQIVMTLVRAFDKYQHKNLLNLYDAIGTLAESVGHHLNQQKYIEIIMPQIIKRWSTCTEEGGDFFPLFESLSSLAVALQQNFRPYAEVVFARSVSLIESKLQQTMAYNADPENVEMPNKDYMIASLDLLSGLAEGIQGSVTDLVANSNIIPLALQCMIDPVPEMRQSSFALLGDLTKSCFHLVKPHVGTLIQALIQNLLFEHLSVCNNATWAIGELALKIGPEMREYVSTIIRQLIVNINEPSIKGTLLDNTAITIGRISFACPADVAPHLSEFIKPWCSAIRVIRDNDAKDSAFRGICELIRNNPDGIVNEFYYFCDAIACYCEPRQDLRQTFFEIFHLFRAQVGEQNWAQFKQTFPLDVRQKLMNDYNF